MCQLKSDGGMGFRDMGKLVKQGWRLITRPDSLLLRVFKVKYFHDTDFLHLTLSLMRYIPILIIFTSLFGT